MAHYFIIGISIWLALNVAFVALRLWVTRPARHPGYLSTYQPSQIRVRPLRR